MRVSQPPQPFLASAREWHPPHLHPPRRSLKRKNARRKHAHVSLRDCGRRHLAPRLEHRASGAHLKMWRAPRALRGGAVAPLAVAPLRQRIAILALGSGRGAKQIPRAPGQHSRVVEEGGSGGRAVRALCGACLAPFAVAQLTHWHLRHFGNGLRLSRWGRRAAPSRFLTRIGRYEAYAAVVAVVSGVCVCVCACACACACACVCACVCVTDRCPRVLDARSGVS